LFNVRLWSNGGCGSRRALKPFLKDLDPLPKLINQCVARIGLRSTFAGQRNN
jgi:hypothetical protein